MRRKTVKTIILRPTLSPEQRKFLESLLSPQRLETLRITLDSRLGDISLVLDNLFDPHNMGAITRTAEALGVQDIHTIERDTSLDLSSKVTKYSDKWITFHRHQSISHCIKALREDGFQILAAQMTRNAVPVQDVEIHANTKIAVVAGNEHAGVSDEICSLADKQVIIPMYGFTESFNVSVATALVLSDFVRKKRAAIAPETGTLTEKRKNRLYDEWLQKAVKKSDTLLRAFQSTSDRF